MGPWPWGLRWIDVPFGMLMCLPWKLCGHGVDVPFGDLMGLRAPACISQYSQSQFTSNSLVSECAGMVGQRYLAKSHFQTVSMVSAMQAGVNLYDTDTSKS